MSLDISTHKSVLLQLLKDIYTDISLGPILGFKGGTAAYLFYELTRFSVALDFDLLDPHQSEYVYRRLSEIIQTYGQIKQSRQKRYTIFFLLSYRDKAHNIKIEVNLRQFGSQYEIRTYFGIAMKVMTKEDMFAHKLVAMMERKGETHRDIFDVWFFLKHNWEINAKIVFKRTNLTLKEFLTQCIDLLEQKSNRNILFGIGELPDPQMKPWAKTHLKAETIFLLQIRLSNS